jgi:Leucine-rich repeat (LRR) protein
MYFNFSNNFVTVLPTWSVDCALVNIDGSYNQISSVEELRDLYNLNRVNLDYNTEIESIDALEGCPALVQVDVYGTKVTEVSALTAHSIVVNFDPTSISVETTEESSEDYEEDYEEYSEE